MHQTSNKTSVFCGHLFRERPTAKTHTHTPRTIVCMCVCWGPTGSRANERARAPEERIWAASLCAEVREKKRFACVCARVCSRACARVLSCVRVQVLNENLLFFSFLFSFSLFLFSYSYSKYLTFIIPSYFKRHLRSILLINWFSHETIRVEPDFPRNKSRAAL